MMLTLGCITGCQNTQRSTTSEAETKAQQPPKLPIKMQSDLGIQKEHLQMIIDECTQIDITFNDLPFTMNQSTQSAIISDLSYIDAKYYNEVSGNCRPMARKVYYGKDGVLLECDLYFSENCLYFVFIKDEIPLFANGINDVGINFYNGVLAKVGQLKQ
jgi:hypothetical protein